MSVLLIDGNSIGHAAHNGSRLTTGEFETQAIFGICKSMHKLLSAHPDWIPLVLWDGKADWRFDLYPEYKSNRAATDEKAAAHKESYKKQAPFMKKALQLLGVRQMLVTSLEADDMAGVMVRRRKVGTDIVLVSGDQDWLQLVCDNVLWFDPIRDRKVGLGNFLEATGYFTPREFLEGKALRGDSSDYIPGVGGIGEKGAPEFMAQFKRVDAFFKQVDDGVFVPKKKAHINLASEAGRAAFRRNYRLMNLIEAPNPNPDHVVITQQTYNEADFRRMCERLAFMSILRDFNSFMGPFRALQTMPIAA